MVPHSWILKCLEIVGAAKNIISTISNYKYLGYKYLGILQLNQNLNTKMKVKITSESIGSVKNLCSRSKLNGENLVSTLGL